MNQVITLTVDSRSSYENEPMTRHSARRPSRADSACAFSKRRRANWGPRDRCPDRLTSENPCIYNRTDPRFTTVPIRVRTQGIRCSHCYCRNLVPGSLRHLSHDETRTATLASNGHETLCEASVVRSLFGSQCYLPNNLYNLGGEVDCTKLGNVCSLGYLMIGKGNFARTLQKTNGNLICRSSNRQLRY